ncbi:hypothetical protein [Gluconacetobacter asukensis]|uniref:Uncharacterized protein n=1 Tax=Gluconacetobacter asukensis TaxID=1017181 RepID=A0A7W4J172_9PROT|nr:hypothetical protein [Gluconacetobacter asukensis]MBB2172835.1 hypothetical protein [Gluconacetobacter asukensis]
MTQHRTREEQIKELADELMFETGMGDGVSIMTAERHAAEFEVRAKSALQAENERLREALDDVPATVLQAVAELPDRSSPDDAPDMMLVTADELASIVRAAIDAAMDREGQGDG